MFIRVHLWFKLPFSKCRERLQLFRPFEDNDESTLIPVVLAELKNSALRLHGLKLVQRSVADAIASHNDPEELCRTLLVAFDCSPKLFNRVVNPLLAVGDVQGCGGPVSLGSQWRVTFWTGSVRLSHGETAFQTTPTHRELQCKDRSGNNCLISRHALASGFLTNRGLAVC